MGLFDSIKEHFKKAAEEAKKVGTTITEQVEYVTGESFEKGKEFLSQAGDKLSEAASSAMESVKDVAESAVDTYKDAAENFTSNDSSSDADGSNSSSEA